MTKLVLRFCLLPLTLLFINLSYADQAIIEKKEVQVFMEMMVKKYHFDQSQLLKLFSTVKLRPEVIHQVKKPLEMAPWDTYQRLFVNEWRIEHGVKFWNRYATALKKAEVTYGVPASIIIATLGIETKYGEKIGNFRVIESLSSLAFNHSPRAAYFKRELIEFLLLCREQNMDPSRIMGSYAGAIGQGQFMPSSYRRYGVDFSHHGKIDLIHNTIDAIGSIAYYYHQKGWKIDQAVATRAFILGNRYRLLTEKNKPQKKLMLSDLRNYGIVPRSKIGKINLPVKIITLSNRYDSEYWISFKNFDVIKRYNASNLYAMSVFQLSTYITTLRERLTHD